MTECHDCGNVQNIIESMQIEGKDIKLKYSNGKVRICRILKTYGNKIKARIKNNENGFINGVKFIIHLPK